jgi:hypothetical protein
MINVKAQKELYDHYPPAQVFRAVAAVDPFANQMLASVIVAKIKAEPTKHLVWYYRERVLVWLRLYGLDECVRLSNERYLSR